MNGLVRMVSLNDLYWGCFMCTLGIVIMHSFIAVACISWLALYLPPSWSVTFLCYLDLGLCCLWLGCQPFRPSLGCAVLLSCLVVFLIRLCFWWLYCCVCITRVISVNILCLLLIGLAMHLLIIILFILLLLD